MAIPVQGTPYAEGPQPSEQGHRRRPPRRRGGLGWVALWTAAVLAVAAYPVYRFTLDNDGTGAGGGAEGACLTAFAGDLVGAPRPPDVACTSPQAHWRVTAVLKQGAAPCRSLPPDKGYASGLEWLAPDGSVLCLTMTPFTTYQDYEAVGTMPYAFNQADFERLKQQLLAATGQL
jgi:hypothetical protein